MTNPLHRCAAALRRRPSTATVAGLLVVWLAAANPAAAEALSYRWNLRGAVGRIAGLVLPNHGHGELRTHRNGGNRVTELEITSPESARGEYFLYGSEMGPDGKTEVAWSSYRWKGEEKSKRDRVRNGDVIDIASGIHLIRDRRPQQTMRLRIWSDGKVYPVVVQRVGTERLTVPAGTFQTEHYRVRGVHMPGERFWKGGLELWLAQDAAATPVRIQVERGFANVRLELIPEAAG